MAGQVIQLQARETRGWFTFDLREPLDLNVGAVHFGRPLRTEGHNWNAIGDEEKELMRALLEIRGIELVTLRSYQVEVHIAHLYNWDNEVQSPVLDAFEKIFGVRPKLEVPKLPEE